VRLRANTNKHSALLKKPLQPFCTAAMQLSQHAQLQQTTARAQRPMMQGKGGHQAAKENASFNGNARRRHTNGFDRGANSAALRETEAIY
jgi:hypothetical protein